MCESNKSTFFNSYHLQLGHNKKISAQFYYLQMTACEVSGLAFDFLEHLHMNLIVDAHIQKRNTVGWHFTTIREPVFSAMQQSAL